MQEIYCDGASRSNPGHAAWAFVVPRVKDQPTEFQSGYLGIATNNEAEYWAIIHALNFAINHRIKHVKIVSDSQLVIRQLLGEYQVKEPRLELLYFKVFNLIDDCAVCGIPTIETVEFEWRGRNDPMLKRADKLCNIVLDVMVI